MACVFSSACTEATSGLSRDAGGSSDSGGSPQDASASDAKQATDSSVLAADAGGLRLNEVSSSDEWIELVNIAGVPFDLSSWRVADRDKSTGEPKLDEAVRFSSGSTLGPGAYALVRGGGVDAGKGCPDGGQTFCVHAEFGISRSNGETLFLLDPDGGLVELVVVPPDAGGSGETWCRIPDGTGDFQSCSETPGAANQPKP